MGAVLKIRETLQKPPLQSRRARMQIVQTRSDRVLSSLCNRVRHVLECRNHADACRRLVYGRSRAPPGDIEFTSSNFRRAAAARMRPGLNHYALKKNPRFAA
jgi:hypothetical protein